TRSARLDRAVMSQTTPFEARVCAPKLSVPDPPARAFIQLALVTAIKCQRQLPRILVDQCQPLVLPAQDVHGAWLRLSLAHHVPIRRMLGLAHVAADQLRQSTEVAMGDLDES